jgi:hypothetical protein
MLPIGHIRRFIRLWATVFIQLAGLGVDLSWMRQVSVGMGDTASFKSDGFRVAQPILRLLGHQRSRCHNQRPRVVKVFAPLFSKSGYCS